MHASIANAQGSRMKRRNAVIATVSLIVVSAGLLPFARHAFPAVPGIPPVFITFSLCLAAISAFTIATQYQSSRSRALLVLASGYAFIALIAVPELIVALARSAGLNVAPSAPIILGFLSQAVFDLHVCWYVYAANRKLTVPAKGAEYVSTVFSLRLVLGVLVATALAFGPWTIPAGLDAGGTASLDGIALLATVATLLYRRNDSILNSWLIVALIASLLGESSPLRAGRVSRSAGTPRVRCA